MPFWVRVLEDEWGLADTRTWCRCILQTVRVPAEPFLSIGFADSANLLSIFILWRNFTIFERIHHPGF